MKKYQQVVLYDENCDFPMYDHLDVLVAGGGPAGIGAATIASRLGEKTLVIERLGFLGGAAVAGYSGTFGGLFYSSENPLEDGAKQYLYGFTDEIYQNMQRVNGVTAPQKYGKTFLVPHNPQIFKEVSEEMVLESGAKILYHTTITGVIKQGDTFLGVVINTKNGFAQIRAKRIIDATGDADVLYRAGADYTIGDDGKIQNPTMIFRLGGVDVAKFYDFWGDDTISPDKVTDLMRAANKSGYNLPRLKVWCYYTTRPNELFMNVTLITGADGRMLNVCDADDHTEAEIEARKQVKEYAKFFKTYIPGCENSFINDLSCEVGIRQTRSIVGIDKLTDEDVANARKRPDGICKCAWPIEIHNGETPYLFWFINDYYHIPYGALVPKEGENLIVAGRNLCAQHKALASCRVISQCFEMGHAAAVAAHISLKDNKTFREIKGEEVRKIMNTHNSQLD